MAAPIGIIQISKSESEGVVRMLIALYHGLTIQLLANPEKIKDNKMWDSNKEKSTFRTGNKG